MIVFDLVFFVLYVCGIVLARGFWSTLLAIVFPIWAYAVVFIYLIDNERDW